MICDIHDSTISSVGGASGIRDHDGLHSVWSRDEASCHYGDPDAVRIGALLAHGIMRSHPFVDGNKRSAYAVMLLTLASNGLQFEAGSTEVSDMIIASAAEGWDVDRLESAIRVIVQVDPVYQLLFDYDRRLEPVI